MPHYIKARYKVYNDMRLSDASNTLITRSNDMPQVIPKIDAFKGSETGKEEKKKVGDA